jgi:ADP-ribose pyrophosphatase YjhB (NUDIX family)
MFTRDMHYIQHDIMTSLANKSPQRFSELQPPRVPNNTFSYHLKKLVQLGYVTQSDDGYRPTRKALKTLQYDEGTATSRHQSTPAMITMLYVTNDNNQILLIQRHKRPFVTWYGLPSGLIHQGETIAEAAARELNEKASIKTNKLHYEGVLDFKYLEQDSKDLFVHAVAFVYSYHLVGPSEGLNGFETKYGTLKWSDLNDVRVLPEVLSIEEIVKRKTMPLESVNFDEPIAES